MKTLASVVAPVVEAATPVNGPSSQQLLADVLAAADAPFERRINGSEVEFLRKLITNPGNNKTKLRSYCDHLVGLENKLAADDTRTRSLIRSVRTRLRNQLLGTA